MDGRLRAAAHEWRVTVDDSIETPSSIIAFGRQHGAPVALKIVRNRGDEWRSGEVIHAFGARGVVRVLAYMDGAMLLERINPGRQLVELTRRGSDVEATEIIGDVIAAMSPTVPPAWCPHAADWGRAFDWYRERGTSEIPPHVVDTAAAAYDELCATQGPTRLLHGDLHHYNVLEDEGRGWLAIDPKGVVAEAEFEIGAMLRNPVESPALYGDPDVTSRRIAHLAIRLGLDADRVRRWSFAQGVLSEIWKIQDAVL